MPGAHTYPDMYPAYLEAVDKDGGAVVGAYHRDEHPRVDRTGRIEVPDLALARSTSLAAPGASRIVNELQRTGVAPGLVDTDRKFPRREEYGHGAALNQMPSFDHDLHGPGALARPPVLNAAVDIGLGKEHPVEHKRSKVNAVVHEQWMVPEQKLALAHYTLDHARQQTGAFARQGLQASGKHQDARKPIIDIARASRRPQHLKNCQQASLAFPVRSVPTPVRPVFHRASIASLPAVLHVRSCCAIAPTLAFCRSAHLRSALRIRVCMLLLGWGFSQRVHLRVGTKFTMMLINICKEGRELVQDADEDSSGQVLQPLLRAVLFHERVEEAGEVEQHARTHHRKVEMLTNACLAFNHIKLPQQRDLLPLVIHTHEWKHFSRHLAHAALKLPILEKLQRPTLHIQLQTQLVAI